MAAKYNVSRVTGDLDKGMKHVKEGMRGVPFRFGTLKRRHDEFARSMAALSVALDSASPLID
ncbi:hypothetical protein [Actinoalloteichus spitiensis]|uniref:hypothetical protein n=1 Tax=Actinoalloteichus spitiensis TaxID=252394 RepID=UPI0002F35DB0|nr:hypothetical protein [Actinoalloteichus spitiensis]